MRVVVILMICLRCAGQQYLPFLIAAIPSNTVVDFKAVALADNPTNFWLMQTNAGGQIVDYGVGGNNLTVSSGITIGQPTLLGGVSYTTTNLEISPCGMTPLSTAIIYGNSDLGNSQDYISALIAAGTNTSGSPVSCAVGNEGVALFERLGNYFFVGSTFEGFESLQMYYNVYATATNPLGTWSATNSIWSVNPLGTGFENQTCSGIFQLNNSSNWYYTGDYYSCGFLSNSVIEIQPITFPTTNSMVVNYTNHFMFQ
jgi:hypothetical protein